uniref:Ubiquitin carboxyl-terminal hydrolase n=1 Tax=Blastobotrys adeninivorans TaxID=409370 RepID=A0A060T833_BLAAD
MSSWNTIESDAGVFTELIENFGVEGAEFEELLSVDPDSLRAVGKLYGVIFLFKYRASQASSELKNGQYTSQGDEDVFFARQMIQNACATQAVLSILMNQKNVKIGPTLSEFKEFVQAFDPELKGEAISNSDVIRTVHNSFSRPTPFIDENDDRPRDEEDDGLYHFVAYVPVNGVLYELDGLRPAPISHGSFKEEELPEKLSQVLIQRIESDRAGELRFNLMALTDDKRRYYESIGDKESLEREMEKRELWHRENQLRKHNFVGLINDLVKIAGANMDDNEWNQAIEQGRSATGKKIEARSEAR